MEQYQSYCTVLGVHFLLFIWMICFLKNIGFLFIIAGVVLLGIYTIQNRVQNIHFLIAGGLEIAGLIAYVLTNRFLRDKNNSC